MRNSVAVVALSALASLVSAQNYTVDPASIDLSTRSSWCAGQENTCNTLCSNDPLANSCSPTDLTYNCTCSNGSAPGLEYYTQTIPTYLCEEEFSECNSANAGSASGQKNCTDTIEDTCGKLDASTADISAETSSSAAPSSTAAPTSTEAAASTAAASATSSSSSGAAAVPTAIAHYGNGAAAVAVGLFAYLL